MQTNKETRANFARNLRTPPACALHLQCNMQHIHFFVCLDLFGCDTDLNGVVISRISESRRLALHQHKGTDLHAFAYLSPWVHCKYIFRAETMDYAHDNIGITCASKLICKSAQDFRGFWNVKNIFYCINYSASAWSGGSGSGLIGRWVQTVRKPHPLLPLPANLHSNRLWQTTNLYYFYSCRFT